MKVTAIDAISGTFIETRVHITFGVSGRADLPLLIVGARWA